ncbi:FAD-dependent oxidoreductase [Leptolyngbya sp. 15MV]|nr:FAD-dependent oxidoreductase [Leptolyngbya sp. 15MV]
MPRIIVIGGGFAGVALVKRLAGRQPSGWETLLISEESYTTYNPMLAEVVGASVFPEHVVAPLRQVMGSTATQRFVMGMVTALDVAARRLACMTLAGERHFEWDHLVLAHGNRARLDLVPGMAEHALPLKTVGDALHIRNVVLRRLARMELEPDMEQRRRLGHFVVIGGGFSGVEVAGALADALRSVHRYYHRVDRAELRVTIVQNLPRLLPELPERLGQAAHRMLEAHGVQVRLGATAAALDADGIALQDGTRIDTRSAIATIGTRPNALSIAAGLPLERGRIRVDPATPWSGIHTPAGGAPVW